MQYLLSTKCAILVPGIKSIYLLARFTKHVCPQKSINEAGLHVRWCGDVLICINVNKETIEKCVCTLKTARSVTEDCQYVCSGGPSLKPLNIVMSALCP